MKILIISTLLLLTIVVLNHNGMVEGQAFDLVRQMAWCKNLTMMLINNTYVPPYYYPDPSVPNNILNDTYFQAMNLSKMSFEDAMNLYRRIHLETNKCTTKYCNCVNWGGIDVRGAYSVIFRNDTNFQQVISVIELYLNKLKPKLLPYSSLQYVYPFYDWNGANLSTLVQFSIKYDYSLSRIYYYNATTCYGNLDILTEFACQWDTIVWNRTVQTNFTNSQLESLLQCSFMKPGKCPMEQKRFEAYNYWIQLYPMLTWRGSSLLSYLETLVSRGALYKPKIMFDTISVSSAYNMLYLSSYKKGFKAYEVKTRNLKVVCLNSKQLKIDCQWTLNSMNYISLVWVNISFIGNFSVYNLQFNMSNILPANGVSLTNGSIIGDKNGLNMLQYFWYKPSYSDRRVEIYYFNTNSRISLDENFLNIISDVKLLKQSTGILIDGFNSTVINSGRRRRDDTAVNANVNLNSNQCDLICDRLNNPKSYSHFSSKSNSKLTSCIEQCNRRE